VSARAIAEKVHGLGEGDALLRLVYARALAANGRPGARAALRTALALLHARAARIQDPALRRTLLEVVPEHARTLALAAEWGLAPDGPSANNPEPRARAPLHRRALGASAASASRAPRRRRR
jgi:hypothetical protein